MRGKERGRKGERERMGHGWERERENECKRDIELG